MTQTVVYYAVTSLTLSAEEVSHAVGVRPDFSWSVGEPSETGRRNHTHWELRSRLPQQAPIADHIHDVERRLDELHIASKCSTLDVDTRVEVVPTFSKRDRGLVEFVFKANLIRMLAQARGAIDVDVYSRAPTALVPDRLRTLLGSRASIVSLPPTTATVTYGDDTLMPFDVDEEAGLDAQFHALDVALARHMSSVDAAGQPQLELNLAQTTSLQAETADGIWVPAAWVKRVAAAGGEVRIRITVL